MLSEKLLKFIDEEEEKIQKKFGDRIDKEKRIMIQNLKLTEEVGEFTNEVLLNLSFARDEKINNLDKSNLANEFADVIITSLICAKTLDIDIDKALENKIEKIKKRW